MTPRPNPAEPDPIVEGVLLPDGWQYRAVPPDELCDYPMGAHNPDHPSETEVREWWGR